MHHETYEELQVEKDIIEHWDFLVESEDMEVKLLSFNGKVIGDTASSSKKSLDI